MAILNEIDQEKAKLTIEDKWYCVPRQDYTFGFQLNPTEEDKDLIKRVKDSRNKGELRVKIREESTQAHQELFKKQNEEMEMDEETDRNITADIEALQQKANAEAQQKMQDGRIPIFKKHLTAKQFDYLLKHDKEIQEMDKFFTEKLNSI